METGRETFYYLLKITVYMAIPQVRRLHVVDSKTEDVESYINVTFPFTLNELFTMEIVSTQSAFEVSLFFYGMLRSS